MRRDVPDSRPIRIALVVLVALVVAYLSVRAVWPDVQRHVPSALRWFGAETDPVTIAIVVGLIAAACALSYGVRRRRRSPGVPLAIVAALVVITIVLGFSSFVRCADDAHAPFFAPLTWTAAMLTGSIDRECPALQPIPVALEIARLTALSALFLSVIGVVVTILQARLDRLRVAFAKSVTVVVGIDDDALSMVSAALSTLDRRGQLALLTTSPDRPSVHEARNQRARVIAVDFNRPDTYTQLRLWRKLDRLYLLSPDPTTNLLRLGVIDKHVAALRDRKRIPLIVRIDDPWQAEAWLSRQSSGPETRWAPDAVGKYEVTARQLLDQILPTRVGRILVCGTSNLTLALCANMVQHHRDRQYYTDPAQPPLPTMTIVGPRAQEYLADHEFRRKQSGDRTAMRIDVIGERASVPVLSGLLDDDPNAAVIFVDSKGSADDDTAIGTRLAARFPSTPVYAWDPQAQVTDARIPLIGRLRSFRLAMDLPAGQAQDAWERAAMLVHERYASEAGHDSPATRPWAELDEFYRGSNRRQVTNALRLVEEYGGHTWTRWGTGEDDLKTADLAGLAPLEQLRRMGFDRDAAMNMAEQEFKSWRSYYKDNGWKYGPIRDDNRKVHNKLVRWKTTAADPGLLDAALKSLATTLIKLRELGYRSHPVWETYRRTGIVTAERRDSVWTWRSTSGETMHAAAGDWEVRDGDGDRWSVRDDIFRSTYEHLDGNRWRRTGLVQARRASAGQQVPTLEGPVIARGGDWVIMGERGELWTMPGDEFGRRYEGPCHESS
jgi:hypothetical protein